MADEQKKIVIDVAGAMEKITPEMMAVFDQSLTEILSKRVGELEAALRQMKENATGQWVPSSVVHSIADAALDRKSV